MPAISPMNPTVELTVAPEPDSVRFVRRTLTRSGLDPDLDHTVTLLTSEVVTNAIRHVPGGTILITLTLLDGQLLAEVQDESASLPVRRSAGERGGWGLELLDLLADQWGVREHPGEGKTVWFRMTDADPAVDRLRE